MIMKVSYIDNNRIYPAKYYFRRDLKDIFVDL
jgi:hypothetical protein